MKTFIVLLPILAIAFARPQQPGPDAQATILKYDNENIGIDGYNFDFETSNGIAHKATAKLENQGSENEAMRVSGSYSYPDATGKKVVVTYEADENGYRSKSSYA